MCVADCATLEDTLNDTFKKLYGDIKSKQLCMVFYLEISVSEFL